jgi:integrase
MVVRPRGAKFELRVKHRLLPKPYYGTFDSKEEAAAYGTQLEALLAQGLLPQDLTEKRSKASTKTITVLVREYEASQPISAHDRGLLLRTREEYGALRVSDITFPWAQAWVRKMKIEDHLAPGTIRKKVGAFARLLDWHLKREASDGDMPSANPLRLLSRGYATYSEHESKVLAAKGKQAKRDVERDRRLNEGEQERILAAMNGAKRGDRERPLAMPDRQDMIDLFLLLVNTGLRLREAYRLRVEDVKLKLYTLHVARSKTGTKRDVPILPVLYDMLERRVHSARKHGAKTPIFPWWNGVTEDDKELAKITSILSRRFGNIFDYADCPNLTEHDLRHEATCRWVLMKDRKGQWVFRTEEVMKITGHKDGRTFMRYVSLRGSDLAERLWVDDAHEFRKVRAT